MEKQRAGLLGTYEKMQEYNYKYMAYPILNSLTQDTADKIQSMIGYSEIMTRGK